MELKLNKFIDHTLLKPDATLDQIKNLCKEAAAYDFAAVCVNPWYIPQAAELLAGTGVKKATVIGFPLGATLTAAKAFEAANAVSRGADELDMVINVGALKSAQPDLVLADIKAVVTAAEGKIVKVILETALLTDVEKRLACELSLEAGAHYVKTSTGFGGGGATVEDVALMKAMIGDTAKCGIKASGGIKTRAQALAMIEAGATRIGTSAGIAIVKGE